MSSAAVNSLLGRLVSDPVFLRNFSEGKSFVASLPHFSSTEKQDILNLNVATLSGFSALVVKVQNNFLWEVLPCTRLILRGLNMDSAVFGQFASLHWAMKKTREAKTGRIERFLDFLADYIQIREPELLPLQAVFSHERTLYEIRNAPNVSCSGVYKKTRLRMDSRIAPVGRLLIRFFPCDPLALVACGFQVSSKLTNIDCVETSVLYWKAPAQAAPRAFHIPAAFGRVLDSAIVSGRTLRSCCEGRRDIVVSYTLRSVASLQRIGIITVAA
jgi:hypothetical protein